MITKNRATQEDQNLEGRRWTVVHRGRRFEPRFGLFQMSSEETAFTCELLSGLVTEDDPTGTVAAWLAEACQLEAMRVYLGRIVFPPMALDLNPVFHEDASTVAKYTAINLFRQAFASEKRPRVRSVSDVDNYLGKDGLALLAGAKDLITNVSTDRGWPLSSIDVRHYRDPEIANWEYVVVSPVFDSTFGEADGFLETIFGYIDTFTETLGELERNLFREKFSFGVKVTSVVSTD